MGRHTSSAGILHHMLQAGPHLQCQLPFMHNLPQCLAEDDGCVVQGGGCGWQGRLEHLRLLCHHLLAPTLLRQCLLWQHFLA